MSDGDYVYSDESSSEEERSPKRIRLDENAIRREGVIRQLRAEEAATRKRNARRVLATLDNCSICMQKHINCRVPTAPMHTVDPALDRIRDSAHIAMQTQHESDPEQLLRVTRQRDCVQLACGHSFHWGCIYTWMDKSARDFANRMSEQETPQCPMCRANIVNPIRGYIGFTVPVVDEGEFQDPALFGLMGGTRRKSSRRKSRKSPQTRKSRRR